MLEDLVTHSEFVYSSHVNCSLRTYTCSVSFYTENELPDIALVICSLINMTDEKKYDKRSLGLLLGFALIDQPPVAYYDKAEEKLYEDILQIVEKEHLIYIDGEMIVLTNLGKISITNKKHYHFYHGRQDIFEHSDLSTISEEENEMFPFYSDMGISTNLISDEQYWPDDYDIPSIINHLPDRLTTRILLQSENISNIYEAQIEPLYDITTRQIEIRLYQDNSTFYPIVYQNDKIATLATQILHYEANEFVKEHAILKCLFQKLWDDPTAVLDYENLHPYFDFVNYEKLTKDSRTNWEDPKLFTQIAKMSNSNCWLNISLNCTLSVLYKNLEEFKKDLNWEELTRRTDDKFLLDNYKNYPWDLEEISNDSTRSISVIEELISLDYVCNPEWDWSALENRLERDFVLSHLHLVDIDLTRYTTDTEIIRQKIIKNIEKKWNWTIIEENFEIDFLYENISVLKDKISFTKLFERIFHDEYYSCQFLSSQPFVAAVREKSITQENENTQTSLKSTLFNEKDFIWSIPLIDLFTELHLIEWSSSEYTTGFECNPYLKWDLDFFSRYSKRIETNIGYKYVSSNILDENIINRFPDYNWDWTALSENKNISTRFIKSHLQLSWNWNILTERMFSELKLKNLGHPAFVEKWNWSYLSQHLPEEFVQNNLNIYTNYWDWTIIIDRLLVNKNRHDLTMILNVAKAINMNSNIINRLNIWRELTSIYNYHELKDLLCHTAKNHNFFWDASVLYKQSEFNIFNDIEEGQDYLDWTALSNSPIIDSRFSFNAQSGFKEEYWWSEVKKLIDKFENKWDFKGLSSYESLNSQEWFLLKYKDKLDWKKISQKSKIFTLSDRQKLNNILNLYKSNLDFEILSGRNDIDIQFILKSLPNECYNFNILIENENWKFSLDDIIKRPTYNWDWKILSSSELFVPTEQFLIKYLNKDWDWKVLTQKDLPKVWSSVPLLHKMIDNKSIISNADWHTLTGRKYFPFNYSIITSLSDYDLDWNRISMSKYVEKLLPEYADLLDWEAVSKNDNFHVADFTLLQEYGDDLDWEIVCNREDFIFNSRILETFADKIDWSIASKAETIEFSDDLVNKFRDYWDWTELARNRAFFNNVKTNKVRAKEQNIISFINSFPIKPQAFHFTHMANAIKIINCMSLKSRNKANGGFENSAGTNVTITDKAHRFARFYFTCKSPTQFYNECLGKDTDSKYYDNAYKLGLPKCPLPVFFVVNIEELLTKYPEKCFYSDGNMQKSSTNAYKISDDPGHILADEIYNVMNKDARQQEFLVENELDLSSLSSLRICCYDEYQKMLLMEAVKNSPLKRKIVVDECLYEKLNKELSYEDHDDILKISTNYGNPYEFRIEYFSQEVPKIINRDSIIRQKGNNIYVSDVVTIEKKLPFNIYFEVDTPRYGSWLIYKNSENVR